MLVRDAMPLGSVEGGECMARQEQGGDAGWSMSRYPRRCAAQGEGARRSGCSSFGRIVAPAASGCVGFQVFWRGQNLFFREGGLCRGTGR